MDQMVDQAPPPPPQPQPPPAFSPTADAGLLARIDAHFLREVDVSHAGRTARLVRAPETQVLPW